MTRTLVEQMNQESRWRNNPYGRNRDSKQYPKRMYRPPVDSKTADILKSIPEDPSKLLSLLSKSRVHPDEPTDDEMRILSSSNRELHLVVDDIRRRIAKEKSEKYANDPSVGLELTARHRYGDDIDILRATFTRTPEEIDAGRLALVTHCKNLHISIIRHLRDCPRIEKYQLGSYIRTSIREILKTSVMIEKKYYRKNMLESLDVELEILRELIHLSYIDYSDWTTRDLLEKIFDEINLVGKTVGGLLKSTVV